MGRAPCCEKVGLRKGRWTAEEDEILTNYIQLNGEGSWRSLPKNAGLLRCGKSCRLRWLNYLRADVKRGNITSEEEDVIIRLHSSLGNRWSLIAGHLPGRTDNEIKNYWNSRLSRKIHSFTRVGNEALLHTSYMNLTENMVGTCKRKRDQISRSAMKKNKPMFPNMRKPDIIDQSLAKKTANPTTSNIIGQVGASGLHNNEMLGQFDERSSVVSWPCEDSTSAFMLCSSNEGPYQDEGLDGEIMCLEDILGSGVMDDASGFLSLNDQERDNGEQPGQVTTSDGRSGESGVWSSNTRTGDSYTCSSSMTDGLLNWDWLWDSANGEGCYI